MDRSEFERVVAEASEGSEIIRTPCEDGTMPFRYWRSEGDRECVVLVHGGSGSWTHWIRNAGPLSTQFDVLVPDLPGLGDAATLAEGYTAQDAAGYVSRGISDIVGDKSVHIVGFSWGSTITALVAAERNAGVKSILLIGPAGLGDLLRRTTMPPLIRRHSGMSQQEILDTNRENLARLMIHDRNKIDDLAAWLQTDNTNRSRFNSPQFARTTLLLDNIAKTSAPLKVIYGEFDAPARPDFAIREARLREVRPDLHFEVIEGGGHWLQYELADEFNRRCIDWLLSNQ